LRQSSTYFLLWKIIEVLRGKFQKLKKSQKLLDVYRPQLNPKLKIKMTWGGPYWYYLCEYAFRFVIRPVLIFSLLRLGLQTLLNISSSHNRTLPLNNPEDKIINNT
jgi:hypothetical protein